MFIEDQRNASELSKFYLFGVCKIQDISTPVGQEKRVTATFSKKIPFPDYLLEDDLSDFQWSWKERGSSWEHFFNQYGMNKIPKEDFLKLLRLAFRNEKPDETDSEAEVEAIQAMQKKDFSANDDMVLQKRRSKQKAFSDKVKLNYGFKCAISGIGTKDLLVGGHIIPWATRKDTRLDPRNGLCLSVFYDELFDKGYITLDDEYRIRLSAHINRDPILANELSELEGKKIILPVKDKLLKEYLAFHRDNIFRK